MFDNLFAPNFMVEVRGGSLARTVRLLDSAMDSILGTVILPSVVQLAPPRAVLSVVVAFTCSSCSNLFLFVVSELSASREGARGAPAAEEEQAGTPSAHEQGDRATPNPNRTPGVEYAIDEGVELEKGVTVTVGEGVLLVARAL